ncbi:hypothetical protein WR25_27052 isoform A [Diploscapter pachys]|uniref:CUB domain-containing protein n=2 Tax=Diploscapter pachys TaxID=2018661 RepID=A0A2A2KCE0_9BILA|nr:hypothetical protein WR25_27052 isoform A [Diploscapter pachys]
MILHKALFIAIFVGFVAISNGDEGSSTTEMQSSSTAFQSTGGSTGGASSTESGSSTAAGTTNNVEPSSTSAGTPESTTSGSGEQTQASSTPGGTVESTTSGSSTMPPSPGSTTLYTGSSTLEASTTSGTSQSNGPATSPGTGATVSQGPGQSTAGPTAPTTPKVIVNYIAFTFSCNPNVTNRDQSVCVYTYDLPKNQNQKGLLATEQSIVAEDSVQLTGLENNVTAYKTSVNDANSDAQTKIAALIERLNAIQEKVNTFQQQVNDIQKMLTNMTSNLVYANQYLNSLNANNCYYKKCMAVQTPVPKTSPTPVPTTPSLVCNNKKCFKYNPSDADTCVSLSSCVGGTGFQMNSSVYPFPVWSPGYSASTVNGYGANLKCVWNLKTSKEGNKFQFNDDQFDVSMLDDSSKLLVIYNDQGDSIQ